MTVPIFFNRYILHEKIAQGGMAEVFRAEQTGESGFSKPVAIKRLLPGWSENEALTTMLIDEAKALVHLNHPNIVQVYELGRESGLFFISMEWVQGVDLRRYLNQLQEKKERLSVAKALHIIGEVLKALDYAHRKEDLELIHRDVSPQNILIADNGEVKLTDFGIAKGKHRQLETTQHQVKGKYAYMSPEQALGLPLTQGSDLFSCGVVLFEMLFGEKLFEGENDLMTLERVKEARLPEMQLKHLLVSLAAICRKALAKEVGRRYPNARSFLEDIRKIEMVEQKTSPASRRSEAKRLSGSYFKVAATLVMFFVIGGISWDYYHSGVGALNASPIIGPQRPVISAPKPVGSLTLRTEPSKKSGLLTMDGKTISIETPYFLGDISLDSEHQGEVVFQVGEKTIREALRIDSKYPNVVKTIQIPVAKQDGTLMVSAKPWGMVTIAGILKNRETPLRPVGLKEGRYQVEVYYPPKQLSAKAAVFLKKDASLKCFADFTKAPILKCN